MNSPQSFLIATSNPGKLEEIKQFLADTPFTVLGLNDLPTRPDAPAETETTIEGNAILKARYYGEKTGLISLSDDAGLFINCLGGWPGVASARLAETDAKRVTAVLKKLKNKPDRSAAFRAAVAVYDPESQESFLAVGESQGVILTEPVRDGGNNFGFNPIFSVASVGRAYAQLSLSEKNAVSHRGRALNKVKHYLRARYSPKDIVVPIALIIKDGKILSSLRNDPQRVAYHKKWEFPGGGMEMGEKIEENLVRETREETGYEIEIIKRLGHIHVEYQADLRYQVYLIPHVCKISGGSGQWSDSEVLEIDYFSISELMDRELIGANKDMLKAVRPELEQVILNHNL